jgi:hypothetical protein
VVVDLESHCGRPAILRDDAYPEQQPVPDSARLSS